MIYNINTKFIDNVLFFRKAIKKTIKYVIHTVIVFCCKKTQYDLYLRTRFIGVLFQTSCKTAENHLNF